MILASSIIIGFIRFCLIVLFLYYLNNKIVKSNSKHNLLQFIVKNWFKYGSISVILVFILVEMNVFSLLNYLFIILLIIFIDFVGIKNLKNPFRYLKESINQSFYSLIKHIESKKSVWELIKFESNPETKKEHKFIFYITIALITLAFIGRFYFYKFDTFIFSDLWISSLKRIISFDNQVWFETDIVTSGEKGLANLYGKITSVSPEVAIESLAIIENVLISIIIYWTIREITLSDTFAPLIAFVSFVFIYTLSPIEIHYLLQNEPVILGLTLALPAMVYTLKPRIIGTKKINFFLLLTVCFVAIGLINLFVLYILLPPFYLIILLFFKRDHIVFRWVSLFAYIVGVIIITGLYYLYCIHYQNDFSVFIQSNLISVSSFSYMPNLVIPLDQLILIYHYISLFGIVVIPFLIWFKKEKWGAAFIFLIYFNLLVVFYFWNNKWVDKDLLRYALFVFRPIMFGIIAAVFIRFLPGYKKLIQYKYYTFPIAALLIIAGTLYLQKDDLKNVKKSDNTPRVVLEIYAKITDDFFPYTYAVVNDNIAQTISINKHFFINYSDFLYNYSDRDSVYHANRKKPDFFKINPELVIPKSILVFVYNKTNLEKDNYFADQSQMEQIVMEELEKLKRRGRDIQIYYETEYVTVYKVINEPNVSKIDDLIF